MYFLLWLYAISLYEALLYSHQFLVIFIYNHELLRCLETKKLAIHIKVEWMVPIIINSENKKLFHRLCDKITITNDSQFFCSALTNFLIFSSLEFWTDWCLIVATWLINQQQYRKHNKIFLYDSSADLCLKQARGQENKRAPYECLKQKLDGECNELKENTALVRANSASNNTNYRLSTTNNRRLIVSNIPMARVFCTERLWSAPAPGCTGKKF